jgi:response regulator RpfG family c-di-GMP phosphodiesterase
MSFFLPSSCRGETVELARDSYTLPDSRLATFLNDLLERSILLPEEWDELDPAARAAVYACESPVAALDQLVQQRLLTGFQADMIRDGHTGSLVLGQYRILGLIGRGGMGVVYRAEHVYLRREVAVKVFVTTADTCPRLLRRFHAEARAAARLHHPNLVACLDAGRQCGTDSDGSVRDYYVMELVNGQDLDSFVRSRGPLPPARACDLFRQVAEGLAEAHRHRLIHRDIKPPNIIVTPDWQGKLLDFGLALHPYRRMTEPGTVLGTIGYMAPEQARDPHTVDARADLFSLGATMYWSLTGQDPYPETGNLLRDLQTRLNSPAPLLQRVRPELPEELCSLVDRMLSTDPDVRPQSASVVAVTLAGLSRWVPQSINQPRAHDEREQPHVVIVEDEVPLRKLLSLYIGDEFRVSEAGDGDELRDVLQRQHADLVVLDVSLPGTTGDKLIESIRAGREGRGPMILLTSGVIPPESLGGLLTAGADDFLAKPFTRAEFRSRVRGLLGRQTPEPPPAAALTMRVGVADLTRTPMPPRLAGDPGVVPASVRMTTTLLEQVFREVLSFAPAYSQRFGRYVRAIASAVPDVGEYHRLKDDRFLGMLAAVAPLHDIGMLAIPHTITHKPSSLDDSEQMLVHTHPVLGSEWITATATAFPAEAPILAMAAEVIRSHHERWDGTGYPDGLVGDRIPLAARVVGLVSAYHTLRSRRPDRPALAHALAVRMVATGCPGQFDPTLLTAFMTAAPRLEEIFSSTGTTGDPIARPGP